MSPHAGPGRLKLVVRPEGSLLIATTRCAVHGGDDWLQVQYHSVSGSALTGALWTRPLTLMTLWNSANLSSKSSAVALDMASSIHCFLSLISSSMVAGSFLSSLEPRPSLSLS